MRYEIDDGVLASSGLSLFSSDEVLRRGAVTAANAGRLAVHAVADEDVRLREAVDRFVRAHLEVLGVSAAASAAICRKLSWAGQSAHHAEVEAAAGLGMTGRLVPAGLDGAGDSAPVRDVS